MTNENVRDILIVAATRSSELSRRHWHYSVSSDPLEIGFIIWKY